MSGPTELQSFPYGWRYVRRQADGTEEFDMVPLTLLDALHPREDDHIPENTRHESLRRHLQNVFEERLAQQPNLRSVSDCLINWDRDDLRDHCPDLLVLERDEPWPWREWGTLHVQREQSRPRLVIEITSPSTRVNDVGPKVEHYHRAGVPIYLIVDSEDEEGPLWLVGHRWQPDGYATLEADGRGWMPLGFGMALAVVGQRLSLYDTATGQELGDYVAVCAQLQAEIRAREEAEEARAEAEQARAEAEQARAEAEQRRQEEAVARQAAEKARLDAERQRQKETAARQAAEKSRAEAEQARASAERQFAEQSRAREAAERREREQTAALEERLRAAEAELARLRGSAP